MTQLAQQQYQRLFKAAPGKILVLLPGSYEIVAVTAAYLEATHTLENDILGKTVFEVFPDDPEDPHTDGVAALSASLHRVQSLRTADAMGIQRYPVRLPTGTFEERFWSPVNSPVLNDAGDIEFIMHRVEDVTAIVRDGGDAKALATGTDRDPTAVQDIILRSQELRQALSKLQEYEARMRTAERLLSLGTWECDLNTGQFNWSQQVHDIYGIPTDAAPQNIDSYFDLVHPDDRESSREKYDTFERLGAQQLEFEHRVLTADGRVHYIRGVGEHHLSPAGESVVGYVQDITALVRTRHQLTQAEQLFRLAGEKVQLGGWRVELDPPAVIWTPETAAIHDEPTGFSPAGVSQGIQYYAPEYRALIESTFDRCARFGEEFDVICQLETASGRRLWVRSIGVADRNPQGKIIAVQGALQDISSLHDAQERADESERQRLDVLESIGDAFFALDENWNFTYLNREAAAQLERSRDELLGKQVWEEFPEAVGSEFQRQYQWAVANRQTTQFQAFYPPFGKWLDVSAYPVPKGLAVYFRDVSQQREHQEQMRLIDAALARQTDMVVITEAGNFDEPYGPRIVYVNDAFERLTGYSKREGIGNTPRMLQGPGTDRQQLGRIREALANESPVRCEVLNYTRTGDAYWIELDITPLFDPQGHCTHFVAVQRDITERKQREAELHLAQERFQLISRATNDVIWDWDFATNRVWWNDSMTKVFGHDPAELEPGLESWTNRIHPDDRERVVDSIHVVIDGKEELWSEAYRFARSDGQYANVIDRGFVNRDANGKATRMVGSVIDTTERMEMEERLRESQKLEAVGHLTGGVAHDFNNLLTVILGNAEMLAELSTDPTLRPMAEMTVTAAQRGAELTSRLLAFARRQPLAPKATDLNQLVEAIWPLIRRTLPENIELEFVPDPDLGIVEIDANELDTALLNLVVNARDALIDGGSLTIETANAVLDSDYAERHFDVEPGEYVMICVSDTGIGMDSATAHRAFEPFFTTKSAGKGSGLGLSMVFGFTKQSGGHIKIYSEQGEGTTIKLYFPRVHGAQHSTYQPAADMQPEGGTEHILIAEDDDLVLQHLEGQLRSLGYRVTAVTSGPEALAALEANPGVDLLLTDIIMPGGMNGRELADRARQLYPSLKVLFTSGYTENAIVHHGRLDPGVQLLSKPYTWLELAIKLRRVLEGRTD